MKVLNRFIDLTDKLSVDKRSRNASFRLTDKIAPSLYLPTTPEEDNEAWFALNELSKKGWFRIEIGTVAYGEPDFLSRPRPRLVLNPEIESEIRNRIGRVERPNQRLVDWRWHVDQVSHKFQGSVEKLKFAPLEVEGMSDKEVLSQLAAISGFIGQNLYLRELSARLFSGASKILDGKGQILSDLFASDGQIFPEKPISLAVHIPHNWSSNSVVFVENETTFVSLVKGKFEAASTCALVYSTGFKASAVRIRKEGNAFLTYTSNSDNQNGKKVFEDWLLNGQEELCSYFWGDLDFSGAQILKSLRSTFPRTAAWEPGYHPMLAALKAGIGHSPEIADKEAQIDPGSTGCLFMDDELLPVMRATGLFLDQEFV